MQTWYGDYICNLCGDKAHPTYPVIDGKCLGVVCGNCDFAMRPTAEEWEHDNGPLQRVVEKLAARIT